MAQDSANEYLDSKRAQEDENDLFAAIGKQVLNLESKDGEEPEEDERVKVVEEIESLCMNCEENGITRLLLTKIPFFREIILMSFYCEHCYFKNTEIQPAGQIQEQGSRYVFKPQKDADLQRQIVKSDTAILRIEDLDIEIPPGRGRLTNVEGVVADIIKDLSSGQDERKVADVKVFEKIQKVIDSLTKLLEEAKFTLTLDDPAGNSSIEPNASDEVTKDNYTHKQYNRSPAQNGSLGLATKLDAVPQSEGGMEDVDILEGKTYELPVHCPGCTNPATMLLQMVNIPYFKQVVLSTTNCDSCDYHVTDVKTGGEIPEKGKRITLEVRGPEDLKRDILKSETCMMSVPECRVEVVPGTMGGKFTTVEGLLSQVRNDLHGSIFDTDADKDVSDSMPAEKKQGWDEFFSQMDKAINAEISFTIILEDPLGGSYCQTFGEPGQDKQVTEEEYERTEEEEDELGLTDMRTHRNEDGEYVKEPAAKSSDIPAEQGEDQGSELHKA